MGKSTVTDLRLSTVDGPGRARTVLDDLRDAAAEHPDRAAVVTWPAGGRTRESLTYAELATVVDRLAAGLVGLGIRRGDVVTLQLPNSWQLVALCLACARIGAVAGPVALMMRRREVEFVTRLTGSPVYIGQSASRGFSFARMSREIADAVPTMRHRVLLDADQAEVDGALDFRRDLLDRAWEYELAGLDLDAHEAGPDDLAQIMFTSGTTGEPKGVMHSHATLYATNRRQAEVLHLTGDEVTAMGSPTTLQGGYTWNFLMPLHLGGTSVQVGAWDPELMLHIIETERVTFFMGAPTFLMDLVRAQRAAPRDLSTLAVFATGSAPIPPVLVEDALAVLGCRVYALWGMTENGCVTVTRPEDPPMRAAQSDGTPVPGMRVRIVDQSTGAPVAPGAVGLLQVRGDSQRGAEKIPVVEVEGALLRHPAVRDVALVGYPDERLGERACAIVEPEGEPPTLDGLRTHLGELGMAKPYWPERLEIVDVLPRTPSGKVQKFLLRVRLTGG
ncbi:MAG: cyclohexanecarboxylate-CoA ligase [Actinobacteria bacterium 13_2_20CM_2_71_6]|nr:MAG: cyclohexanecarboxylate-CoA ligase [Actinobacteria bacterium 13_2_20CM_2_71_6]